MQRVCRSFGLYGKLFVSLFADENTYRLTVRYRRPHFPRMICLWAEDVPRATNGADCGSLRDHNLNLLVK